MDTSNHRVTHQSRASVPAVASSGPEPEKPVTAKEKKVERNDPTRAIKGFSQCFGIFYIKKKKKRNLPENPNENIFSFA